MPVSANVLGLAFDACLVGGQAVHCCPAGVNWRASCCCLPDQSHICTPTAAGSKRTPSYAVLSTWTADRHRGIERDGRRFADGGPGAQSLRALPPRCCRRRCRLLRLACSCRSSRTASCAQPCSATVHTSIPPITCSLQAARLSNVLRSVLAGNGGSRGGGSGSSSAAQAPLELPGLAQLLAQRSQLLEGRRRDRADMQARAGGVAGMKAPPTRHAPLHRHSCRLVPSPTARPLSTVLRICRCPARGESWWPRCWAAGRGRPRRRETSLKSTCGVSEGAQQLVCQAVQGGACACACAGAAAAVAQVDVSWHGLCWHHCAVPRS